jgi:hypothetical protein
LACPAGTDAHEADLAEANQRAAAAEREAAMLRAMVEVLRLDRDTWREQAQRGLDAVTRCGADGFRRAGGIWSCREGSKGSVRRKR